MDYAAMIFLILAVLAGLFGFSGGDPVVVALGRLGLAAFGIAFLTAWALHSLRRPQAWGRLFRRHARRKA